MPKTFTLSTDLLTQTAALAKQDPCELLFQSQMMHYLTEEFEDVSFSPSQDSIDNVLAYSKAVEVKASSTMINGLQIVMN